MAEKIRRAVFIEPRASSPHIFSAYTIPRLGSVLLATILKERGWDVKVYLEEAADVDFTDVLKADFVGISTITPTAPRAYVLAEEIQALGVPVVLGGPHVTFLPEEGLGSADMVVRGEGEQAVVALAEHFEGKRDLDTIPGLSWRRRDEIVHNPQPEDMVNLDTLPFPDLSLVRGLDSMGMAGRRIVPMQTTRGCPFDCNFCSVTQMFGRRLRKRSVTSVLDELEKYDDGATHIFFYDDNFTADRRHALAIAEGIIERGLSLVWSAQVRSDISRDPELLEVMGRAGCITVFIGFESVNPEALAEINKTQSPEEMGAAVLAVRNAGIDVHGMFMFGLDSDNHSSLKETVRFARQMSISTAQFLLLTPIPGTKMYEQLQRDDRLLFDDWSLYDGHHVVHKPRHLTPRALQRFQLRAHSRFYSRIGSLVKLAKLKIVSAVVDVYARRINREWKRQNRFFMRVLKLYSKPSPFSFAVNLKLKFPDVKAAVARAQSLKKELSTAEYAEEIQEF
jgi:radical SAM superfamily enzyme YgiQ (UPF0313 family)